MSEATRLRSRHMVNNVMLGLTGVFTVIIAGALLFILGYLFINGARNLDWAFFTQLPKPTGETGGGMANAIVGSAKILGMATLIGVPIGFLGGVYLAEYGNKSFAFAVRYLTDLLNGVPSIVIGIFAFTLVVLKAKHFSAFAGGMALGLMMIPISVRSTEEFLRAVPNGLREGALALGTPKWRALATVVIPAAKDGIITGIMLNLARVAGETAPLLFTSLNNQFWSPGVNKPTSTLPVMIYTYALSPYDDWHRQAWAAGFVLLMLILTINVSARMILSRSRYSGAR
ncbi:MAG TPA: phosphate ABC transporter permease PstA [Gemmatimonadaceae bacterium]|nr:phosphate ABC transporter permease PstA [Gemmatimonadaceae bacterium]